MKCFNCETYEAVVTCGACDKSFCRKNCWQAHWCNVLTDHDGAVVQVGDYVAYSEKDRLYVITETWPSFTRVGLCYGDRIRRNNIVETRKVIRPRLMKLQG